MGVKTDIQWCDSSINLQMGCDGCELWHEGVRACYAGTLTERYGGQKGFPKAFHLPVLFPERMKVVESWEDLSGRVRPEKPWLNGYPRVVFLNDMGDTFTESLPRDWLARHLSVLSELPHTFIVLTKRAQRGVEFFLEHGLPSNFWFLVSVTTRATLSRLEHLARLRSAEPRAILGLSVEPILEDLDLWRYPDLAQLLDWVVVGGESDQKDHRARHMHLDWMRRLLAEAPPWVAPFVKQLGSNPWMTYEGIETPYRPRGDRLGDRHGGDWTEWPPDLRVRFMPTPRLSGE